MKSVILLGVLFHITQSVSSFGQGGLGIFGGFQTTLAPIDNSDPTTCRGKPRKWGFCSGTSYPTRSTTDSCPKLTEKCSTGTLQASQFIASSMSSSNAPTRCRRFTHDHQYVEENPQLNSFFKALKRTRRNLQNVTYALYKPVTNQLLHPGFPPRFIASGGCTARKKRQVYGTGPIKRDIAILMDESGSVGKANFDKMKRIASAFVKLLCGAQRLGVDQTRMSLTSFDSKIHHHKNLIDSSSRLNTDASHLAGFIDFKLNYNAQTQGYTCLEKALDFVRGTVLNANGARRGERGVVQEVLLLSDGCENCNGKVANAAARLREAGIDVYVIGIALGRVCQTELDELAQGGKCFHFFNIVDWKTNLDDFIEGLENPPQSSCLPQLFSEKTDCVNPGG